MSAITFEYAAVTANGQTQRGTTAAATRGEAYRAISRMGLTPVSISAKRSRRAAGGKAKARDVADFTNQLAVLLSSKIPLAEGLRSIAAQEAGAAMTPIIDDVARRVEAGERVADALAAHDGVFGNVYIRTVRAAEESGNLPGMLEYLATMLEHQQATRQQIRGALMYPACVTGVLALAVTFMLLFVVPKFGSLFEARGVELPVFTKALLGVSGSINTYWWIYVPAIVGVVWAVRRFRSTESGRVAIDAAMHRVPYVGKVLRSMGVGRFARVMGVCLGSGLSLIEAIRLAGEASGRPLMHADAERMAEQVRVGGQLGEVLESCGYLTPFARRMLGAGENSGELPRMCEIVADHHDRQGTALTKNLGTVLEPLLVVVIAAVVMAIALAIFLPMWNMAAVMGA